MMIPPLQAVGQALAAGAAARTAASAVSGTFARLLDSAPEPSSSAAEAPAERESPAESDPPAETSGPPAADGSLNVPALKQQTEGLIRAFHGRVQKLARENGIDLAGGVHLTLDDFGRIQVSGGHPQKEQLEQLLETRPELGQMLQSIATRSRLLQTIDQMQSKPLFFDEPGRAFELYVDPQRAELR